MKSKIEELSMKRELSILKKNEQMVNFEKVKAKH